jgi:steroid delta-isomerase
MVALVRLERKDTYSVVRDGGGWEHLAVSPGLRESGRRAWLVSVAERTPLPHDMDSPENLDRMADFFSRLSPDHLEEIPRHYAADVHLSDPINEAVGHRQIHAVMSDLFRQLQEVRFEILNRSGDSRIGFLHWNMHYHFRKKPRCIEGVTMLVFNPEGFVTHHQDFWDASLAIYGEFPLLGLAMKGIRKVVAVKHDKPAPAETLPAGGPAGSS